MGAAGVILASVCCALGMILVVSVLLIVGVLAQQGKESSRNDVGEEPLDGDCLRYKGWFCESRIKLKDKISTPMGSNLTVVVPTVDIDFTVIEDRVTLRHVRLSRSISRSRQVPNVHSPYTGEAWHESYLCKESQLINTVEMELEKNSHGLRSRLFKMWCINGFAMALNRKKSAAEITSCFSKAHWEHKRVVRIMFMYTRHDGAKESYSVIVKNVSNQSIFANQIDDYTDKGIEEFRIDRISNVQNWTQQQVDEYENQQAADS